MPEWLIEAEDGIRRTWTGDISADDAEQIRAKLASQGEWNCQVTKREIDPEHKHDIALEVHTAEWRAGGEVGPKPFIPPAA